jgi:hypothetical protein
MPVSGSRRRLSSRLDATVLALLPARSDDVAEDVGVARTIDRQTVSLGLIFAPARASFDRAAGAA